MSTAYNAEDEGRGQKGKGKKFFKKQNSRKNGLLSIELL